MKIRKKMYWSCVLENGEIRGPLPRPDLFYRRTAFLKKDAVAAIGTPDIDIDLDFLFAPCTLVGADHNRPGLGPAGILLKCTVERAHRDAQHGGHGLVCAAGELVPALPAFPDASAVAVHGNHVALRAAVVCA